MSEQPAIDREERIEQLFHAALEREPRERERFLAEACAGDDSLHDEVTSLLQALDRSPDLCATPAWKALVESDRLLLGPAPRLDPDPGLPFERIGDCRLLRKLGAGASGLVYLATQEPIGRLVALKILRPEQATASDAASRFQREIGTIGALHHPSIVAIFASGQEQGIPWYAMEYVPGHTLAELIAQAASRNERLATARVLGWIRDVANALLAAHDLKVVHRDVKPANIRITPEGRPVLVDFGIAQCPGCTTLTQSHAFRGTVAYASPEQVDPKRGSITARTDIYSLGATLYEALTGRTPFQGNTTEQVLRQILDRDPLPPRQVNASLSRDLEAVMLTAMEKEPSRRYASMADFAADLERVLSGEAILARPASAATKTWRKIKRNRALSGAAVLAALAMLALAIFVPRSIARLRGERLAATTRLEEVRGLSDIATLRRLQAAVGDLWPAVPDRVPALRSWLKEADTLAARLPTHRRVLEELRQRPANYTIAQGSEAPDLDIDSNRWWRETLQRLITGIEHLGRDERPAIETRLQAAQRLRDETVEKYRDRWDQAIASIADSNRCPTYGGLRIEPQLGLVPIGQDPHSKLWEFAHIQTGSVPERDREGNLQLTEESGLVFVLVPRGEVTADLRVEPFFISKYEMTQGQWLRATQENPSYYHARAEPWFGTLVTLVHPVENVSWEMCDEVMRHLDLRLPTEAEWDYAARGDSERVARDTASAASLAGSANLCDRTWDLAVLEYPEEEANANPFDDGYGIHARVDRMRANAFGLYNVVGNVSEWCADEYVATHGSEGDSPVSNLRAGYTRRTVRSGGFTSMAAWTRLDWRDGMSPSAKDSSLGARPARSLRWENGDLVPDKERTESR
ncbi:MAG: bifunctional serine/threonine-protein kinase/formylglycine-generating enzyme family protein [Planctomycetota bacterium]